MKAAYPSDVSPAHPHVAIDLPDSWVVRPHANAVIAAHDPAGSPNSPTTVFVTLARVANTISLDEAVASAHKAIRRKYPGSALQRVHTGTVDGKEARFAVLTISDSNLPTTVFHSEVSVLVPTSTPEMNYVIQVLCKCSAKAAPDQASVFANVIASLKIS